MFPILFKRIMPHAKMAAVFLAAFVISGCGGGGDDDSDTSPPTVRPKSLDGIRLTLDSNVGFEFIRNTGGAPALVSGDIETGTFFYNLGGVQLRAYRNISGDDSDCRYPDSISTASYSYRAINASSAVLTLTGVGINDLNTTGRFTANNGSFVFFFNSDSNRVVNNQVVIDLTFAGNGSTIISNTATVMIPAGSPLYDTVVIPTAVGLAAGGLVPENYNPVIDPLRPSKIAPESLDDLFLNFTNGIPDPALNFTIQFVAEAGGLPSGNSTSPDEIGKGLLRVAGAVVDDAVNYTWKRIGGTDNGTLVISGANSTFDGTYTLQFQGTDNGLYIGQIDGGTPDAAAVSGRFFIPAGG